ncbi:hypothetical protein BAY61_04690 [Prauserella marina]|nr:RDD family protein [Prauserella marina]ASR34406.1 hypothetical protein BAY61_04690 [Prauserella marina]
MARWTGEWLSSLSAGGYAGDQEPPRWPGEHLGLPQDGIGAVAGSGRRFVALLADLIVASLLTSIFIRPDYENLARMQEYNLWSLAVWAFITIVPAAIAGFTPGMAMFGLRVARLDGAKLVGAWRAVVRTILTFLIIPAAVRNADNRGWHDRLTNTVVVQMR